MNQDDVWQLNIVAPNFEPGAVGGAGEAMVSLTNRLRSLHANVRIYLTPRAAEQFPDWKDSIVEVPAVAAMQGRAAKAIAMLELGFRRAAFPSDGVCWFPFGTMLPFLFRGTGVVTIHDTLDRDFPDRVALLERCYRRIMIPQTVRHCAVVTSSETSRARILKYYGVDAEVVPLAPVPLPEPAIISPVQQPYVFFAANSWPHKNHRFLLDTWRRDQRLQSIVLVFTLGSGMAELAPLIQAARREGVRIVVTGRITRAELAAYYKSALCSVLPSTYEGFGLTIQESLQANCPVLVSDCAALPETIPAAYPYVLPLNGAVWAETVLHLKDAPRPSLGAWADQTSWEEVALKYLAIFKSSLAQRKS